MAGDDAEPRDDTEVHAAAANDLGRGGPDAAWIHAGDARGLFLAGMPAGWEASGIAAFLEKLLDEPLDSPNALRLLLLRAMREFEPRPYSLGAIVAHEDGAFAAVTPGATIALVRDGALWERVEESALFELAAGDRVAMLCARLSPLLQDPAELTQILTSDQPGSAAVTLIEVGHLRGGSELAAVVAEIGGEEAPAEVALDPAGFGDLLAALADTMDELRPTPPPAPKRPPRNRGFLDSTRSRRAAPPPRPTTPSAPPGAVAPQPVTASNKPPTLGEHTLLATTETDEAEDPAIDAQTARGAPERSRPPTPAPAPALEVRASAPVAPPSVAPRAATTPLGPMLLAFAVLVVLVTVAIVLASARHGF